MCFSGGTREAVSNKDGTGILGTCCHHHRAQGSGGVVTADGSRAGRAWLCQEGRVVLMMARESPDGECRESGPWQGRTKDHRVWRLGEILKQVLNKASPAAAITLCN